MKKKRILSMGEVAKRWFKDVFETKISELPKALYHYTDAKGLIGMLTSGEIWATDYRFLNDKSEMEHTLALVRGILAEKIGNSSNSTLSKLYTRVLELQEIDSGQYAFVFSLSEEDDDLSQWRGYAREGEGFTIGFSARSIYETSQPDDAEFGFCKIEYDIQRQTDSLEQALEDVEAALLRETGKSSNNEDDLILQAAEVFDIIASDRASSNKHKSFRSEREWRAISMVNETVDKGDTIRVRASGNRLVRFVDFNIKDDDGKLPIERIGIGPGFTSREEVLAVNALCKKTGYNPEIYYADTPYRRF